jgi:hypothetical protein
MPASLLVLDAHTSAIEGRISDSRRLMVAADEPRARRVLAEAGET